MNKSEFIKQNVGKIVKLEPPPVTFVPTASRPQGEYLELSTNAWFVREADKERGIHLNHSIGYSLWIGWDHFREYLTSNILIMKVQMRFHGNNVGFKPVTFQAMQ